MSMTDPQGMRCSACGVPAVAAFVQYGSYFTMCMACRDAGPATSWLALKTQLQGSFRAVAVGSDFELKDEIAVGEILQIAEAVSKAAHQGQLVRLTMAADLNIAEIPYDTGAIRYRYGRVLSADGSRWIRHGPFVEYHLNGRIASEGTYVNGVEHGLWRDFYETGQIAAQGEYQQGVETGAWRYWSPDGAQQVG